MTRPRPVSARYGWAARQSNQAPVRLTAIERSKSVRLMSPIGPRTLIPALFTRTSTLPNRSIAALDDDLCRTIVSDICSHSGWLASGGMRDRGGLFCEFCFISCGENDVGSNPTRGFGDRSTEPPRSSGHDGGPPVEAELAQRIRCCVLRRSWVLPCLRPNSGGPSRHHAMSLSQTESS